MERAQAMERVQRIVQEFKRLAGQRHPAETERKISLVRLGILFALLPILRWDVIEPEAEIALTGLTALTAAYILAALLLLPRLRGELRKDLFLTIDILAIAALVWFTGGVNSTLLFLFYLPVLTAAIRLDLLQAILSAIGVSGVVAWMWTATQGALPSLASSTLRVGFFVGGSLMLALVFGIMAQESRMLRERAEMNRRLNERLNESTDQLQRRLNELEFVYDLSRRLAGTTGTAPVLTAAAEAARQLLRAPYARVFLSQAGGSLVPAHTAGASDGDAAGMMEACAARVRVDRPEPAPVEVKTGGKWTRGVCMPIIVGDRMLGVLCAGGGDDWVPARHSVAALGQLAYQAGIALDRAWLLEEMQRLAAAKPDARVFDTGQFELILRNELSRATQLGSPFALLKLGVRDADGAAGSDDRRAQLLARRFAHLVLAAIRRADVVAQAGPGEIFILLSMTDLSAAEKFAARLLDELDGDAVLAKLLDGTGTTGIRVGIAMFPENAVTAAELTFAAQNALEAADPDQRVIYSGELDAPHPGTRTRSSG